MKTLFIKVKDRINHVLLLPVTLFIISLLFIVSLFFTWAIKPNQCYNEYEGQIQSITKEYRSYFKDPRGGPLYYAYEFTINTEKYEVPANLLQLKDYNVNDFIGKIAYIRYQNFIGHTYPDIVTLKVDGKDIITNENALNSWLLWFFLLLASSSWLVWRFIKYWKSV